MADFTLLTKAELSLLAKDHLVLSRECRKTKDAMLCFILEHAGEALRDEMTAQALAKASRKRSRTDVQHERRVAQRVEEAEVSRDTSRYLQLPAEAERLQCHREFLKATSSAALQTAVCAVCAREVSVTDDGVELALLTSLPNTERLRPIEPHAKHDLFDGCLLAPEGVIVQDQKISTLQRGMRGTVSTYELDTQGVVNMAEGGLMPRLPAVLAKVISVTFIGVGPLPKKWLRTTFRVRRHLVHAALLWLRANHRHYSDITISEERLQGLPEDDVPDELLGVVRHCSDPGVSLQEGGGIDTDLTRMNANDMMMWGLNNLWSSSGEGGYSIRHSRAPVSDYPRTRPGGPSTPLVPTGTNYFERAFPCLFPYGRGGVEGEQPVTVELREHIRWALLYHDRRFRTHETFPFVGFGILQRREALGSARIQIRRKAFEQEMRVLSSISVATMQQASQQEAAKQPITDPAVLLLKRLVHAAAGRVQGTDAARYKIRGQIWSTCLTHGPPSMWITINPTDIHDPIAQLFAGAEIDMDRFIATEGPSAEQRAAAIAEDPYAAAKFFHFMVGTILETLFQVRTTTFAVKGGMGVLGRASAYVGTVESQGRGSLHLHMLLWLQDTPRSEQLHELLQTDAFRDRVRAYIHANIRAYLPGLETAQSVRSIPKDKEIAYSRPPDPSSPTFAADVADFELRLARAQQVHSCKVKRCLRFDKKGSLKCKCRAPFEFAEHDYVKADGRWGPKRLYRYMNGWIRSHPSLSLSLLTNGADTKNITFYVSSYAGKKQGKNHNLSAILADAYLYNQSNPKPEYMHDLREQQRLLLFRLINSINREQELAAPMVISYLMGWGDMKTSHSYASLYWSSFSATLYRTFPELRLVPR
ncbi:hypothetical protein OH76DRAFT_1452358 [Lentinus brumalis]|uniref:Uncharacterized protein n=1 Tax=Lentinus brumalis TaxID=2498619 RepID=A0A371DS03_9APHY|nr:hypothetical protein OH76DRAFT_1452358 [Polyporus brumalis]